MEDEFRQRTTILFSESDLLALQRARLILRRLGKMERMPSMSDALSWMLAFVPLEDMLQEMTREIPEVRNAANAIPETRELCEEADRIDSIVRGLLPEMQGEDES